MSMPETAMYKDSKVVLFEYQVRFSGECRNVQPIAKPSGVEEAADPHFGLRVARPNPGHHPGTGGFVHYVNHSHMIPASAPQGQLSASRTG